MKKGNPIILRDYVEQTLDDYFTNLDGHKPANLYEMVLQEIEAPLIKSVLKYTDQNQSIAAAILGISRGTLRKKLQNFRKGE
jgi:Fis family transcriptional regulator